MKAYTGPHQTSDTNSPDTVDHTGHLSQYGAVVSVPEKSGLSELTGALGPVYTGHCLHACVCVNQ